MEFAFKLLFYNNIYRKSLLDLCMGFLSVSSSTFHQKKCKEVGCSLKVWPTLPMKELRMIAEESENQSQFKLNSCEIMLYLLIYLSPYLPSASPNLYL